MPPKKSNVDVWIKRETPHRQKALENASRHFDDDDALSVHILEGIYGQESSFGIKLGKRNSAGAAGDFQLEKKTAIPMGLTVSEKNDQRFDVDDASAASAKYLKTLDESFAKKTNLGGGIETAPVSNPRERLIFNLAAFNAGEGRIARAQQLAETDGKNPEKWEDVQQFLRQAGASAAKIKEIVEYVEKVLSHASEFAKKSKADKNIKNKEPAAILGFPKGGHWITKDGKHILIKGPKQ